MTYRDSDALAPWRIPAAIIALLIAVIALITLAALGLVGVLAVGAQMAGAGGFDLSWPDDPIRRIVWVQGALTMIVLFLVWLFSILVVAAHVSGWHGKAAANAVAMVRISIAIIVVQFAVGAVTPFLVVQSWSGALASLATGTPLVLGQIALLLAADAYFRMIRQNATS